MTMCERLHRRVSDRCICHWAYWAIMRGTMNRLSGPIGHPYGVIAGALLTR